jgi:hypothetical protein
MSEIPLINPHTHARITNFQKPQIRDFQKREEKGSCAAMEVEAEEMRAVRDFKKKKKRERREK